MLFPLANGVAVPARAAYSHYASLGSEYSKPSLPKFNLRMNSCASSKLTFSIGHSSPQSLNLLGLLPIIDFHCAWVISYRVIQNPVRKLTFRFGDSAEYHARSHPVENLLHSARASSISASLEPIKKSPAGT